MFKGLARVTLIINEEPAQPVSTLQGNLWETYNANSLFSEGKSKHCMTCDATLH